MAEEVVGKEVVANESATSESAVVKGLRVYKKKSTFKGAGDDDFYYSATRSDGCSVICKFKCEIATTSNAFEIYDIIGNMAKKEVVVKGETYTNYTYYITSCKFREIVGEPLPF